MSRKIQVSLADQQLRGTVTNMDALYFAGLILPNYADIRKNEVGLRAAFTRFSQENADILKRAEDGEESEALSNEMYDSWGERFLLRITNDLSIRAGVAQRLLEIFPDISPSLVSYSRWSDIEGNLHDRSSIRLDIEQAMDLITPIINTLNDAAKAKAATRTKPKGFAAAQPAPIEESAVQDLEEQDAIAQRRAQLQKELASLE